MIPVSADITLYRNADFWQEWSFVDGAGQKYDFTGWTPALEFRLYGAQPGDAKLSLSPQVGTEGLQVLPGADRDTITVRIKRATIDALPGKPLDGTNLVEAGAPIIFAYDLAITDPTGFRQVFRSGRAIVQPGVTVHG